MTFELQPTLQGKLLTLRPLRPEDFPELFAVASDPAIWEQHPARDRYQEPVFRDYFQGALDSGGAFLVLDAQDGRVIGSTRYHGLDEAGSEIEIGWTFLARSHWGGAFNRDMKRLLLEHAFRFVDNVIFVIGANNLRSQKATEKIGAVRVGAVHRASTGENLVYRIQRNQFRPEELQ